MDKIEGKNYSDSEIKEISENLSKITTKVLTKTGALMGALDDIGESLLAECIAFSLNASCLFPPEQIKGLKAYFIVDRVSREVISQGVREFSALAEKLGGASVIFCYMYHIKMHFYPELKNVFFGARIIDGDVVLDTSAEAVNIFNALNENYDDQINDFERSLDIKKILMDG